MPDVGGMVDMSLGHWALKAGSLFFYFLANASDDDASMHGGF